jgi:hypothetical protein
MTADQVFGNLSPSFLAETATISASQWLDTPRVIGSRRYVIPVLGFIVHAA